jgi:hypothetical protein
MRNRPAFNWDSALKDLRAKREAETKVERTAEQRAELLERQRNARVNSVMRTGFRQRNSV